VSDTRQLDFDLLQQQLAALTDGEPDPLANTANFVALLYDAMADLNWAGIYVLRDQDLVLGPFQGKPACVRMPLGQGVCGSAAAQRKTLRVANVDEFPGHIVCDAASKSEIVVPLLAGPQVLGVLDVDSPYPNRFSEQDQTGIEMMCVSFARIIEANGAGFI
jgi:GAF domain-containing protein